MKIYLHNAGVFEVMRRWITPVYAAGRWSSKGEWYAGRVRTDRVNNNLFALNLKKEKETIL